MFESKLELLVSWRRMLMVELPYVVLLQMYLLENVMYELREPEKTSF